MTKNCNHEAIEELFTCLHRKFGELAPVIIETIVDCVGDLRLTFPGLQDIYRMERNKRLRNEFNGANYEELAIRYRLKCRQVRRIIGGM